MQKCEELRPIADVAAAVNGWSGILEADCPSKEIIKMARVEILPAQVFIGQVDRFWNDPDCLDAAHYIDEDGGRGLAMLLRVEMQRLPLRAAIPPPAARGPRKHETGDRRWNIPPGQANELQAGGGDKFLVVPMPVGH